MKVLISQFQPQDNFKNTFSLPKYYYTRQGEKNDMISTYLASNENNSHENLKNTFRIILKDKFIMLNAYLLRAKQRREINKAFNSIYFKYISWKTDESSKDSNINKELENI